MQARVICDGARWIERVREDEPDRALLDREGLPVAPPRLETRLRERAEAESPREEIRARESVADVELDVVDSAEHGLLRRHAGGRSSRTLFLRFLPRGLGVESGLPRAACRSMREPSARAPSPPCTIE